MFLSQQSWNVRANEEINRQIQAMDDENGQLVKSEPTPVSDPFKVYNIKNAFWADPDLEDAAQCLRALYDDPKLRARLAKKSRETIEHHFSFEAVGRRMATALADKSSM